MTAARSQYLATVRLVVVKLGTQLLTNPQGQLDTEFLAAINLRSGAENGTVR